MVLSLLVVVVCILLLYKYWTQAPGNVWTRQGACFMEVSAVASAWDRIVQKVSLIEFHHLLYKACGNKPYVTFIDFLKPVLFIKDLELARQVMTKDFSSFSDRKKLEFSYKDVYLPRILTVMSGREWKDLRSAMTAAFSTGKIRRMLVDFNTSSKKLCKFLDAKLEQGVCVTDFQEAVGRYAIDSLSAISFGQASDAFEEDSHFRKMAVQISSPSTTLALKMFLATFLPAVATFFNVSLEEQESATFFAKIIAKNIEARRQPGFKSERNDFLQLLLEMQSLPEHQSRLDDITVIAQCIMFIIAGNDGLETLLAFLTYELALNPDVQEKLAEEIQQKVNQHGELTCETLQEMPYLDAVIAETFRLHPSGIMLLRECTAETLLPQVDLTVPKGALVILPLREIHRDPKYYQEPLRFNPDNFLDKSKRNMDAYLPFGFGPRKCIANRFALLQAKVVVAHLVSRFQLEVCDKTVIPMKEASSFGVMRPVSGPFLKFSLRDKSKDKMLQC